MIALLIGLRLIAPMILQPVIAARLSRALGVPVSIESLELSLMFGELTLHGVHAAPEESASRVDLDVLTVHWRWRPLLRGLPFLDVRASGLGVTIDLQHPWPRPEGERKRSNALHSAEVEDGVLAVVMDAESPPILALTDLHAGIEETSTGAQTDAMTTQYWISAQTGDGGSLNLDASSAPFDPAANWSLRFALERLDLRVLNPLFDEVFEMDVEHGWFSLSGEVNSGLGRVRGRLRPRFEELELLGRGEQRVRHPMAEALFSSMLSGADLPIDIDQAIAFAGGGPVEDLAQIDSMQLLSKIILRGFVRRLDTLDGYTSSAERIEVDFPAGRLSFFGVQLNRIGGGVGVPFVSVAQLDIVVDQSAIDKDVPTYKSIILHEPSLVFVTGTSPQRSQLTFDPDWQKKVSVLPYKTEGLEIIDGRVEYRDDTTEPSTSLFASDIQLKVSRLASARVDDSRRGAKLEASARFMDLSTLKVSASMTPGAIPIDAEVRLSVDTLQLDQLNELLHGRFGIDISTGTMALTAGFDVHEDHLVGSLSPVIRDVRVLGEGETELLHPVRELMLERRLKKLDGAALVLDYTVRFNLMRELPGALLSAALGAEKVPQPKLPKPMWRTRAKTRKGQGLGPRPAR